MNNIFNIIDKIYEIQDALSPIPYFERNDEKEYSARQVSCMLHEILKVAAEELDIPNLYERKGKQ